MRHECAPTQTRRSCDVCGCDKANKSPECTSALILQATLKPFLPEDKDGGKEGRKEGPEGRERDGDASLRASVLSSRGWAALSACKHKKKCQDGMVYVSVPPEGLKLRVELGGQSCTQLNFRGASSF